MSIITSDWFPTPLVLQGGSGIAAMTREQFFEFCRLNPDVPIERTADGDLVIMTPAGNESSARNLELSMQLAIWTKQDGTGKAFDSSAAFWLPEGALRSPDAAWIRLERWNALSEKDRETFAPLAPDFVAEMRSKSDRLAYLRRKMREYADNGVRLAWLIDPLERRVEIYRPGQKAAVLENPTTVAGDPELPGFALDLTPIW